MNWDAPGCFGGTAPDITPNLDRLAAEGKRFMHAHVTSAVCQPCRSVLMTGRYPHRNGAEGFEPIDLNVPTLQESLKKAGYLNGIFAKVGHLAPASKFPWDTIKRAQDLGRGRDAKLYDAAAREFFGRAARKGRPFFLMANSDDPHRPFHGSQQERNKFKEQRETIPAPSRVYGPDEVEVPGFLPDLPDVRKEVAQYYCSVRRCDDTVGAVLRALRESGHYESTLIMFLSDHGMAFPFAKTNCYLNSTRTPWIVVWPGRVKPGTVDTEHLISGIDFMPTVLEAAGLPLPAGMDGSSFLPVLQGESQPQRDKVFTEFHQTSARRRYPMRCVHDRRFAYIFNPWSDGQRAFRNESQSGLTFKAMQAAAETDPEVAARVKLFQYRVLEEFYDLENDPDALRNLIDAPDHAEERERLQAAMRDWLKRTKDPALEAFENRHDPAALARFMAAQDARSGRRPKRKKKNRQKPAGQRSDASTSANGISA
jgi:N-sulfoglucosamine sulfohydrolase